MTQEKSVQGNFVKGALQRFSRDRGALAAAAVSFYLLLSMIPLLLLLISVAAFFVSPQQALGAARGLTSSVGAGVGGAIQSQVLSVVQHRGVLTGISLLVGLWAGSQVFAFIEMALNQILEAKEDRSFFVQRGLALLMVIIIGILMVITVALGYLVHLLGRVSLPLIGKISELPWIVTALISILLPILLITLVFLIIYRVLPAKKLPLRVLAVGALTAGILWVIVSQLFSWYTANIANYSVLYGSLGGLILLLLWFNYSSQIMLLGAEVSAVLQARRNVAQDAKT